MLIKPAASFWGYVNRTAGCWEWAGGRTSRGYGAAYVQGRQHPAHRLAYMAIVGPIPDGMDLDHLCRNRMCVNPSHLEPVSRRVNLLRSPITVTTQKALQTHCIHGHEFTESNTIIRKNGTRKCRECRRVSDRRYRSSRVA